MRMFQDSVEVDILPDCAKCTLDKEQRNPLFMNDDECPIGEEFCIEGCPYYTEDWSDKE